MRYIITTRVLHLIFIYLELTLVMAKNQSAMQELTFLWNNLPDDLKSIISFSKFKAHLKL